MSEQANPYDLVIADLEAQRDKLNTAIDALKGLQKLGVSFRHLASGFAAPGQHQAPDVPGPSTIPHDAFYGMTVIDAAKKYLGWGGNRLTRPHAELCEAIREGGFQTNATNFREVVRSTLGRHPDFVKIKGQWGLKEWYMGRGIGVKKQRRNTLADAQSQQERGAEATRNEPEGKSE